LNFEKLLSAYATVIDIVKIIPKTIAKFGWQSAALTNSRIWVADINTFGKHIFNTFNLEKRSFASTSESFFFLETKQLILKTQKAKCM
jgi:hypothetical protein